MELQFKIINDHIGVEGLKIAPVADSVNHLEAVFTFDSAWDGTIKTAIFGGSGKTYHVILDGDRCVIPWEVLGGAAFTVSVFGIVGTERITATEIKIPLAPSGYKDGDAPSEPSDSAYTQLLQMLSWMVTNKAALTKFAEGSTDVPEMINISDGVTLSAALDAKADKNQYASTTQAGVIQLYAKSGQNRSGLVVGDDGVTYVATKNGVARDGSGGINTVKASNEEIDAGTDNYKPIVPSNLDYAVKSKTVTEVTADETKPVSSGAVYEALDAKQDTLTFDTAPTTDSVNPVTSGGIRKKLDEVYLSLDLTNANFSSVESDVNNYVRQVQTLQETVYGDLLAAGADGTGRVPKLEQQVADLETRIAALEAAADNA